MLVVFSRKCLNIEKSRVYQIDGWAGKARFELYLQDRLPEPYQSNSYRCNKGQGVASRILGLLYFICILKNQDAAIVLTIFISSRWSKMAHSLGLGKCRDNHQAPGFIVRKLQKSPVSSPWYSGTEAVMIRCSTFKSPISTSTMQATMESEKGEFVFLSSLAIYKSKLYLRV